MAKKSDDLSTEEIQKLSGNPAAQQLISLLRSQDPAVLNAAMEKAAAGDYRKAAAALSEALSKPEAQALLKQLGGARDG